MDATGGTSTEDPEEEPDHPPFDDLKASCARAWTSFPFKVGTQPFKSEVWNYFYPCEDLRSVEDGIVLAPYDGQVKCIFFGDDQAPTTRKGGVVTLTNFLIGKAGTLRGLKPKLGPNAPGFRIALTEEYYKLAKIVSGQRVIRQQAKRKRTLDKKALKAGATKSSDLSFKEMQSSPSDTAKIAVAKKIRHSGGMGQFLTSGFATVVSQHSDRIAHDQARLFIGSSFPDSAADSPLFHQFVKTVLEAGKAGVTLPPTDTAEVTSKPGCHIQLLTGRKLGGAVLDDHSKLYHDKVRRKQHDFNCSTKRWGFSATSDGTDRMGKGVVNLVLLYKDGTTTFLKLHDASGETKGASYITQLLVGWFTADDFPLDPMDLMLIIMDGGEKSSFNLIEQTFAGHGKLPSIMCVWCGSHGFNLLLKAFGNLDGIDHLIEDVKFVINFVRNHGLPRSILRELSRLSMLVWCITRFGTIFICMERLIKLQNALRKLILHPKWEIFFGKQCGDAKEKAIRFRTLVEDRTFFAKMLKTVELTEPVYAHLRICDADIHNTIGAIYDFWLKIQGYVRKWESKKFSKVDGVVAFRPSDCSLVGNQTHEDNGKKDDHGFTAEEMVSFRWTKMATASNTNKAHVLGRWLNPACIEEDLACDDQISLAREGLTHYFPNNPTMVRKIWTQHKKYMDLDPKGELFYDADGKKKRTCDLEGPDHGCSGSDWWFELDYPYDTELGDLRAFAMRFLSQKAQESAAERHYSVVDNIQSKNRGRMQPKSVEKRCLFRSEVMQEIAEWANGVNQGLQTVNEAAAEDLE